MFDIPCIARRSFSEGGFDIRILPFTSVFDIRCSLFDIRIQDLNAVY